MPTNKRYLAQLEYDGNLDWSPTVEVNAAGPVQAVILAEDKAARLYGGIAEFYCAWDVVELTRPLAASHTREASRRYPYSRTARYRG